MPTSYKSIQFKQYDLGEHGQRPWGHYVVTGLGANGHGEEFAEKEITVNAGQILSLQSHKTRRETWTVKSGVLTVVQDDKVITLTAGQSIHMPLGSIHCMANTGTEPCVVYEKQEGVCREEDITRYVDAYGRAGADVSDTRVQASMMRYKEVLNEISGRTAKAA
jgi:mannose-6-phosphate isomerase-like protein (cupin superfamily)